MTIILDSDTGKFYSLFWGESDAFEKLRMREITLDSVRKYCADGQDYVKIQRLEEAIIAEES